MATGNVPFVLDPELTAVSNAIVNEAFINDQVLPVVEVSQETFKYLEIPRGEMFNIPQTRIGPEGIPNEVDFHATERAGFVHSFALMATVPNSVQEQARNNANNRAGYDPRARASEGIVEMLDTDREQDMATVLFDSDNYDANNISTLTGTAQWSHADANPIRAVRKVMDRMIMRPNIMVVGQDVATELILHPKLVAAAAGQATGAVAAGNGVATLPAIARLMGLENIYVGTAWINQAKFGQDVSFGRMWGRHAALLRRSTVTIPSARGLMNNSWGVTFTWPIDGRRLATYNWQDPAPGATGVEKLKVSTRYRHVVTAPDFGWLFLNAVAAN